MVDMLDKKRKEKVDAIVKQQQELAEKEMQERRVIQKQETVKIRTLKRMATERGVSMQDLQSEMHAKDKQEGGGDDVSSIGDPLGSHRGGVEEVKGDDHSIHSHGGLSQSIHHQISNRSQLSPGRGRTASHDSRALSSLQHGGELTSHRSHQSRSPSPSADFRFNPSCELTEMPLVHDASGDSVILILGDPECGLDAAASDPTPRYAKEILQTTHNLVNFSLYCGYNNLRMEQIPDDLTHEIFTHDESSLNEDDHWLTASFYLNITKEHVDGIREATSKIFDPILHSLDSQPLNSLKLIYEAMNIKNHETHQHDEPYTPQVAFTHNGLRREHALWKSRQIMSEVLRYQLQQEAMKEAYLRQDQHHHELFFSSQNKQFCLAPNPTNTQNNNILADLRVLDITGRGIVFEGAIGKHMTYIRLTIGSWSIRTPTQHLQDQHLHWENMNLILTLPKLRLEDDEVRVELFDEYELRSDLLVGSATHSLSQLIGSHMGHPTKITFTMLDHYGVYSGDIIITFLADHRADMTAESIHSSVIIDDNQSNLNHIMGTSHSTTQFTSIELAGEEDLSLKYPSLLETQTQFSTLVDDLRGDGHDHVKRLIGDIQVEDVLKLGHRVVLNSMKVQSSSIPSPTLL
jgi:hypothetical protein